MIEVIFQPAYTHCSQAVYPFWTWSEACLIGFSVMMWPNTRFPLFKLVTMWGSMWSMTSSWPSTCSPLTYSPPAYPQSLRDTIALRSMTSRSELWPTMEKDGALREDSGWELSETLALENPRLRVPSTWKFMIWLRIWPQTREIWRLKEILTCQLLIFFGS